MRFSFSLLFGLILVRSLYNYKNINIEMKIIDLWYICNKMGCREECKFL